MNTMAMAAADEPMTDQSVSPGGASGEWLEVLSGVQSGASVSIDKKNEFTVGSDYENDIVLSCVVQQPVKLQVSRHRGMLQAKLIEGRATFCGDEMNEQQWYRLSSGSPVCFGGVGFAIQGIARGLGEAPASLTTSTVPQSKRFSAIIALIAGFALLATLGLRNDWLVDANQSSELPSLEQQLSLSELSDLSVVDDDPGNVIVRGRVSNRDEFNRLRQLTDSDLRPVSLDVQIDADLVDGITDVYRNHGINARVDVLGYGHVRVETEGADPITLASAEIALENDLTDVKKLETVNTPAERKPDASELSTFDPMKEVEAVVAGKSSYIITRDQSRYFEGAILPSGHTIKSIREGTVVMLREGQETTLNF